MFSSMCSHEAVAYSQSNAAHRASERWWDLGFSVDGPKEAEDGVSLGAEDSIVSAMGLGVEAWVGIGHALKLMLSLATLVYLDLRCPATPSCPPC